MKISNPLKIVTVLIVAIILTIAWTPWLTEAYGKEKVLDYFNQKYNINIDDIIITSVEKKPFEIHFGLSILGSKNHSSQQTSVHAWVTFYGKVKHDKFMKTT